MSDLENSVRKGLSVFGLVHYGVFYLEAKDDGLYFSSDCKGISADKKQELLAGNPYPSADAAEEAATGRTFPDTDPDEAPMRHATMVCTHIDGTISHRDGNRRHLTNFRFHSGNYHYTVTYHQHFGIRGWVNDDSFYYLVPRRGCGCA